jgi:hypothetical protein
MNYSVVWLDDAITAALKMISAAADPGGVLESMERARTLLSANPEPPDSLLHEGLRSLNVPPLRILYCVDHSQRLVEIVAARTLES